MKSDIACKAFLSPYIESLFRQALRAAGRPTNVGVRVSETPAAALVGGRREVSKPQRFVADSRLGVPTVGGARYGALFLGSLSLATGEAPADR